MKSITRAIEARHEAIKNGEAKGFTLIELLVVVIIIGILAAIAIPVFLNQREAAWKASVESDIKNTALAVETYAVNHNGSIAGADNTTNVPPVQSTNNAIVVTVAGNKYTIAGSNSDYGAHCLTYDSSSGGLSGKVWTNAAC